MKKKHLLIFILSQFSYVVFAQINIVRNDTLLNIIDTRKFEVKESKNSPFKVELIVKNICNNSTYKLNDFTLSRLSNNYIAKNGVCVVPVQGLYKVENFGMNSFDIYQIDIKSDNTIDTLIQYKIHIAREPGISGWSYYAFCNEPCNGRLTDYYENGKIRITGLFENGHFKNIKQYNKEGQLVLAIKESRLNSITEVYKSGKRIVKMNRILFFHFVIARDLRKNKNLKVKLW